MTLDEVKRCINEGGVVECKNVLQRGEAVQFLIDIGYKIHPNTKRRLEENPENPEFLYPGLDEEKLKITCWCWIRDKQIRIPFEDIEELIAKSDLPIDERDEREFLEAFAVLMG